MYGFVILKVIICFVILSYLFYYIYATVWESVPCLESSSEDDDKKKDDKEDPEDEEKDKKKKKNKALKSCLWKIEDVWVWECLFVCVNLSNPLFCVDQAFKKQVIL